MIKFTYNENGVEQVIFFEKYYELLRFVAQNRIKDEDFIGLQFGSDEDENRKVISGIDGLVNEALAVADGMEAFEQAMEHADEFYEESEDEF